MEALVPSILGQRVTVMEALSSWRRIVLAVTNIPEEQPPRPEAPPTIHTDDTDLMPI